MTDQAGITAAIGRWGAARRNAVEAEYEAARKMTSEVTRDAGGVSGWVRGAALSFVGSVGSMGYPALLGRSLKKM